MCIEYVLISFTVKKEFQHSQMCTIIRPCIHLPFVKMLTTLEPHGIFVQIIHHSAGNYQFAIHTLLLVPGTDQSTFTMCRAHYGQLILRYFRSEKANVGRSILIVGSESSLSTWCKLVNQRQMCFSLFGL